MDHDALDHFKSFPPFLTIYFSRRQMFSVATLDGVGRLADEISAADGGGSILFLVFFVVVRMVGGIQGC